MSVEEKNMSFLEHLEELRWHIVKSFIAVLVIAIVLFFFQKQVYDQFLLAHLNPHFATYQWFCNVFTKLGLSTDFCYLHFDAKLQSLSPANQLMNAMWSSFILGFIIAFPYVIYEMLRFIFPGLKPSERKNIKYFIIIITLLLILGLLFSFYIICPMSVYFFYNYQITDTIVNNFQFDAYISMITNTILGVAIVFEIPVVIYFLAKLELISSEFLINHRKHAMVLILIAAAIITPPDIASQIIVSIPIMILYEISIIVAKIMDAKK